MTDGADTKTSQLNAEEYEEYLEPFLAAGKDVLHLTLSSGISGTINSARIAQENLQEKYPDRKIYIVDSLAASSGYGLLMDKLADLRDEGRSIDEVRDWAESHKKEVNHWFFSSDLTFFIKGGRVSKTAGFIGSVMNICPLLNVDFEGKLIPRQKVRTKKKVIQEIVRKMEELAVDGLDYADKCYISNSACPEDAKAVADLIEARFPKLKGRVEINSIGTTIGSHTGPGTVALFFWGAERED
jgi:DegV family protein with EDD domain